RDTFSAGVGTGTPPFISAYPSMLIPAALTHPMAAASTPGRSAASGTARSAAMRAVGLPVADMVAQASAFQRLVEQQLDDARGRVAGGDRGREVPNPEQGRHED